jgi:hypothetical protein
MGNNKGISTVSVKFPLYNFPLGKLYSLTSEAPTPAISSYNCHNCRDSPICRPAGWPLALLSSSSVAYVQRWPLTRAMPTADGTLTTGQFLLTVLASGSTIGTQQMYSPSTRPSSGSASPTRKLVNWGFHGVIYGHLLTNFQQHYCDAGRPNTVQSEEPRPGDYLLQRLPKDQRVP